MCYFQRIHSPHQSLSSLTPVPPMSFYMTVPRPGIYWAVFRLQYCCRIQEGSVLNSDRCVLSVLCSEKHKSRLMEGWDVKTEVPFPLLGFLLLWVMSLYVPLPQIKTKKQSFPKGFDSVRFDWSMLLQTCTVSMQLLVMQKDLKAFSPLCGVRFCKQDITKHFMKYCRS